MPCRHVNVLEWLSQSPDLNLIENLWSDLTIALHQASPSSSKEQEHFSPEEWAKIQEARFAKRRIPRDSTKY